MRSAAGVCGLCGAISWEAFKPDADVWMTHPHTRNCLLSGVTGPVRMFQAKPQWRPMDQPPDDYLRGEEVLLSITDEDDGEEVVYAAAYDHDRRRWIYAGGTFSDDHDVVTFKHKNGWLPMPMMLTKKGRS